MTTASESGAWRARSITVSSLTKASVAITTAGTPARVSSVVSWTLHDVHDPQLARPTMAASQSAIADAFTLFAIAPLIGTS